MACLICPVTTSMISLWPFSVFTLSKHFLFSLLIITIYSICFNSQKFINYFFFFLLFSVIPIQTFKNRKWEMFFFPFKPNSPLDWKWKCSIFRKTQTLKMPPQITHTQLQFFNWNFSLQVQWRCIVWWGKPWNGDGRNGVVWADRGHSIKADLTAAEDTASSSSVTVGWHSKWPQIAWW